MSNFVLVAAKPKAVEGKLVFLSTQTCEEFAAQYCDPGTKVACITNPKGDGSKHPTNQFIQWHLGGQTFNGSVSHKITDKATLAEGKNMISIAEDPTIAEKNRIALETNPNAVLENAFVVILHKEAKISGDNITGLLG